MNLEFSIAKDSKTQLQGIKSSIIINRFKLEGRPKTDLFFFKQELEVLLQEFKNLTI